MNRIDTEHKQFRSDFGTNGEYPMESTASCSRFRRWLDGLLFRLLALWQVLTGAAVRRIARAGGVVCSLIGMLGVAGAMERGTVSLMGGLAACAVLLGIEFLCLRTKKNG